MTEVVFISSDDHDFLSSSSSPQPLPPPFKTPKSVPLLVEDSSDKTLPSKDEKRVRLILYFQLC